MAMKKPPATVLGGPCLLTAAAADAEASEAVDRLLARLVAIAAEEGAEALLEELMRYTHPEDREQEG